MADRLLSDLTMNTTSYSYSCQTSSHIYMYTHTRGYNKKSFKFMKRMKFTKQMQQFCTSLFCEFYLFHITYVRSLVA